MAELDQPQSTIDFGPLVATKDDNAGDAVLCLRSDTALARWLWFSLASATNFIRRP
jgi:hypothetical protein